MNVRKMLRIYFVIVCKIYVLFVYRSVGFEANIEYTEKGITSAMECADVAVFTFVTRQIISCTCKDYIIGGKLPPYIAVVT